jgi:hypothetical protein
MRPIMYRWVLLAVAIAPSGAAVAAEPASRSKPVVEKLLLLGSKSTPAAAADALALYNKLDSIAPGDRRNAAAYATVLLAQRRYRDAQVFLEGPLKASPVDVHLRLLKLRASLGERRQADLIDDLDALASAFGAPSDQVPQHTRLELAKFVGTVFGYLELVRSGSVEPPGFSSIKQGLLHRLNDAELAVFDEGRNETAKALTDLRTQIEAEQQRIERARERSAEAARSTLDDAKEKQSEHDSTAQSSQETASDAAREAEVLAMQLQTLQNERARVAARYSYVQAQYQMAVAPITSSTFSDFTRPGSNDPRPIVTTTTTTTTVDFSRMVQANALALQLAAINKQAFDMDRKILALQSRMSDVSGDYVKSSRAIEESDAASREIERKAKIAEKKLKQKPRTSNARITALRAQLSNFSTYAPFDYEAEKKRVLSLFDE